MPVYSPVTQPLVMEDSSDDEYNVKFLRTVHDVLVTGTSLR